MYIVQFGYGHYRWQWQRDCQIPFIDKDIAEEFAKRSIDYSKAMDVSPYIINSYRVLELDMPLEVKSEITRQFFEEQKQMLQQKQDELENIRELASETITIAKAQEDELKAEKAKSNELANTVRMLNEVANSQKTELDNIREEKVYKNGRNASAGTYLTTQIAKSLGMSARLLNQKLADAGVQYKRRGQWLLTAKYQNKGYTKTETVYYKSKSHASTKLQTVWTEEGRLFIKKVLCI